MIAAASSVIDPLLEFSTYFGGSGFGNCACGCGEWRRLHLYRRHDSRFARDLVSSRDCSDVDSDDFVAHLVKSEPYLRRQNRSLRAVGGLRNFPGRQRDRHIVSRIHRVQLRIPLQRSWRRSRRQCVHAVGNTTSTDFPIHGVPYQTKPKTKGSQCSGITCSSIFVSVLNTQGSQLGYSSYLSGNGNDQASGMAIDTNARCLRHRDHDFHGYYFDRPCERLCRRSLKPIPGEPSCLCRTKRRRVQACSFS